MFLDFVGGIVLTAVIVVNVNAVVSTLDVSRGTRLALAAIIGLWVGLQVSLATAGVFASQMLVFPAIGIMVVLPVLTMAAAAAISPAVRAKALALPTPLLIGLNFSRVLGVFFLLLAAGGRLGGPFPQFAGWGDIATGFVALRLAIMAARRTVGEHQIWTWNLFGAADLLTAVTLGTLSFNGSPLQAIKAGAGSDAVLHLPWSLIPSVLVPFYLILHGIVFAQLRQRRQHVDMVSAR
jgi:hypothetical protein